MSPDPVWANKSDTSGNELTGAPSSEEGQLLDALPGPAWVVSCEGLQVLRRNSAAKLISSEAAFTKIFSASLDIELLERLRSPQLQISFHATLAESGRLGLFSAALIPETSSPQRLILAQPAALFDVPEQVTFDELLDSAFDGLAILDSEGRFVQVSMHFQEMFGYSVEDVRGQTPQLLVPPDRVDEFESGMDVLNRGGVHQMDTLRRRRDKTLLEVRISSQPIASGRFRGGKVVIYHDLTESNRHARHSELRLEATRILATAATVNQAARELLPSMATVLGWDVARLWEVCEDKLKCAGSYCSTHNPCGSIDSPGMLCTLSAERIASDGHSVWHESIPAVAACTADSPCTMCGGLLAAVPIMDPQQQVVGVLELLVQRGIPVERGQRELLEGICAHLGQFITRCKAEMALAENELKFRTLTETAPIGIFIHSNGIIRYLNAACESITGYSREEILDAPVWQLFHPDDREEVRLRAERRQKGENLKTRWESRFLHKNGDVRWIDYSAARITNENQPAILVAVSDITERRNLEIQLRQTQKMEAIGRLAGGIAHDFNNLLMVIGCCSELIGYAEGVPESVRKQAREISQATDRASALTRQLLAFSRHQVLAPRYLDLNTVLTGTGLILRRTLDDDIDLRFNLEPGLGSILADSSQIEQVVMNLVVNARDAMPNGGELNIRTSTVVHGSAGEQGEQAKSYAVLTVADNGVGMTQEVQQHIFEPFFTTKNVGKGTGLGLATVYGIAKQSGGFVTVESQINRGTTFKVFFPIASGVSANDDDTENPESKESVCGTVLLVEDEPDVRAVLHDSLVRDGHTVLQAANGSDALVLSSSYDGRIDLLITDVVMPGMSGRDLVDILIPIRPDVKVLYVSGYNEDTVLQKGVVEGKMDFLQKPFSPVTLSRKVREILLR